MSICPTPPRARKTDYTSVGSITFTAPDAKFEFCKGGTTSVLTTPGSIITSVVCCPSPGPQGPKGDTGPAGPTLELFQDGTSLGNITTLNLTGSALTATVSGTDGTITSEALFYDGTWTVGISYKKNAVVVYLPVDNKLPGVGNGYVCRVDHTASTSNAPPDDGYWDKITDVSAYNKSQQSFIQDLQDNVFDWMKNATIGDWLQALAIGAGIVYAGSKIIDMITGNGTGDGNASSKYNGTAGYNGSFTAPSLQSTVASLLQFAGKTSGQYDVSQLPNVEVHAILDTTVSIRQVLSQLALVYQFDIINSGGVIKCIPRTNASVRTLQTVDMGHQQQTTTLAGTAPYTAKRLQGIDLPKSVTVTYNSPSIDYNGFSQTATLDYYVEGQDTTLAVPLTLNDSDAKQVAEAALVNAHIERQQYTFVTDYYNIDLEPGDVVDVTLDSGGTDRGRIIQLNETSDGLLELTLVGAANNTNSYTISPIDPSTPPSQTTNQVATIGYSQALFIEVPPLSDSDNTPRIFAAVHGYNAPGWPGASLYASEDGGITYAVAATATGTPTIGMVATTTPAPADYHVWDTTTTITVQLKQGTLTNSTDIGVINGANWCMIGEEVIGFVNATYMGSSTYQLSRLLRGRAGSEPKCGTHVSNELFVVLDDQLTRIDLTQADIGKTVKYKTVTIGSDLSKVSGEDVKPFGLNMRPWAVAQPAATRNGTTGDWTITWVERPRFNNGLRDYTEITHDPDYAGFGVAILSGSTVKRSVTITSNSFVYTADMQMSDFGSLQTNLNASITQMSSAYGGGYPAVINV